MKLGGTNVTEAQLQQMLNPPVASVNGQTGDVTLSASDVGAVPTTRKINNKALSSNIALTASDVKAIPTSQKGVAGGVAELDDTGKIPESQLPSISGDVEAITIEEINEICTTDKLISFVIENNYSGGVAVWSYSCVTREGMTLRDWIGSVYNTIGVTLDEDDCLLVPDFPGHLYDVVIDAYGVDDVSIDSVIIENHTYWFWEP
jgi:DNA-binding Xre family transcriptional regulator